jgi:hypothetical protein
MLNMNRNLMDDRMNEYDMLESFDPTMFMCRKMTHYLDALV